MQLAKAQREALKLMEHHGLNNWVFAFDRGTRRLGATYPSLLRITLSKKFVQLNVWEEVKETILHEIAHALTNDGHSLKWKREYARIGGTPNRNYANLVPATKLRGNIRGHCPNCNRQITRRIRAPLACSVCCDKYNDGKYSEEFKIVWS